MKGRRVKGEERLTQAVLANSDAVLAYLRRRVNPEDAADLLGETFLVAWRRINELPREPERARMWLFGIARGTLRNHVRGTQRRLALAESLRGKLKAAGVSPGADAGIEVRDAISRLDPVHAELVRLVHWEKMTIAEASEIIGIPASTGRTRYQRAREQLQRSLSVSLPSGDAQ